MKSEQTDKSKVGSSVDQESQVVLIDGVFSPENASAILQAIISDKIKYHTTLKLGHYEQRGTVHQKSALRIKELSDDKEALKLLLEQAAKLGVGVKVNATINIEFVSSQNIVK